MRLTSNIGDVRQQLMKLARRLPAIQADALNHLSNKGQQKQREVVRRNFTRRTPLNDSLGGCLVSMAYNIAAPITANHAQPPLALFPALRRSPRWPCASQ
jgi:hypothetical protein